jgi:hypothetical protein
MAFDVEGAKRAGYSDAEIQDFLKTQGAAPAQAGAGAPAPAPGKTPEMRAPVSQNPSFLEDVGRSGLSELTTGVVGALTLPRTATDLLEQGLGVPATPPEARVGNTQYPSFLDAMTRVKDFIPGGYAKPQTPGGKLVGTGLQTLPTAMLGPGGTGAKLAQWAGSALGSEGLGQALEGEGGLESAGRVVGSLGGASLPAMLRKLATPNAYNPKALANYKTQQADVAANTTMMETPEFQKTITALRRGGSPVDVGKYFTESFGKLTPQQQAAARSASRPSAPAYTGPGKPPPGPPPSWTGDQFSHIQDALRRDIAKTTVPKEKQSLLRLQSSFDDAMDESMKGKPYQGSWGDLRAQRNALDADVEKRIASGGMLGKAAASGVGALAGAYGGAKMGLPPGIFEALATAGGGLMGLGGQTALKGVTTGLSDKLIPGFAAYRRNQMWQPSDLTRVNMAQQARMLGGGDLVLPPLLEQPPQ